MPQQNNPELQKLIDSSPELRELLSMLPPDRADLIWSMEKESMDALLKGDVMKALEPPKDKSKVKTIQEMAESGEEMVFLCMRCTTLDENPHCIVPGCFPAFWSRKPLPLVLQRQGAKRPSGARETAPCPLG